MRFSVVVALAASIASTSAFLVERQNVPTCALTCISTANLGSCSATDNTCLCNNSDFVTSVTSCIESTCDASDLAAAEQFAIATCEAVGVTLSPPAATGTGTATAPGGSATPSGSNTSAGSSSSSKPAGTSSSAPAATTTKNAASANGVNAVVGVAALGLAVLAL